MAVQSKKMPWANQPDGKPYTDEEIADWARENLQVLEDCILVRRETNPSNGHVKCDRNMREPDYWFALSLSEIKEAEHDPKLAENLQKYVQQQVVEEQKRIRKEGSEGIDPSFLSALKQIGKNPNVLLGDCLQNFKNRPFYGEQSARRRQDVIDSFTSMPDWMQVVAIEQNHQAAYMPGFRTPFLNSFIGNALIAYALTIVSRQTFAPSDVASVGILWTFIAATSSIIPILEKSG